VPAETWGRGAGAHQWQKVLPSSVGRGGGGGCWGLGVGVGVLGVLGLECEGRGKLGGSESSGLRHPRARRLRGGRAWQGPPVVGAPASFSWLI